MPLTGRNSARRRRGKKPDEKLPERPEESTFAKVMMASTRMKLRVRRRGNAAGDAVGGSQLEEEEGRSQESGGRSSRRKNSSNTSAAATSSSSPPSSSASASASTRAVMAAEDTSPDSKCPICLDRFNNLAYLDRCLHRFCFPCIQEWSHNKAECPLCKQPFASILHSVRAEDDFKEYTLRPAPANSSIAATVAMVAAMASAARSNHQMRLMLRRHRGGDAGEMTTTRRQRRERRGRTRGGTSADERTGVWEWYLDSPHLALPHHPAVSPVVAEDSEEGEDPEGQRPREVADLADRGVMFEGLTGLGGAVAPVAPNERESRRLMTRLAARQRLQREGGTVRRARERETVAFRRALYRCGVRVHGIAGVSDQGQPQRDITAESFRRNPLLLNRLRPWLRRELTVLYGAHGSLVVIVQRIILASLARHGLEDTPTIEEELRPFLLARTEHFLHELVSFACSPLSLENYDLQAVYEPPATAMELDGTSSSSDSSSVIAISEGEEEERQVGGRLEEERMLGRVGGAQGEIIQTGSSLSLSAWDDDTPGPSYSTTEPSCSLASLSFSPVAQEAANEEGGEKQEEECLIVGYKKPIAERTPELVQLSSDTEEEEGKEKKEENMPETLPFHPSTTSPLSFLPIIPPSTSGAFRNEQEDKLKEKDGEADRCRSRARSWSGSSERSRTSMCSLSPPVLGESERRGESWRDRRQSAGEAAREKKRRKRSKRGREKRKSGTLYNPNRCIYPAMMCQRSRSSSPFHSSVGSSPPDSSWEYRCSQVSPLTSSVSSPSCSSWSSSPRRCFSQPSTQSPPTPSVSPSDRGNAHHGEKPGGKRKYKSRHLDSNDKDPTWRPSSSSHRKEKKRERKEKERRRRRRDEGRRRERQRKASGTDSRRRSREERSPSVEIIYEGTFTSSATQPPTHKRHRKRRRRTQDGSSPVIITLDSDSSRDNANINSSSSSPISSQQTVDFSDLPPLPLLHSAGVDQALSAEIGELPVDILDRGSDGSDTEPVGRSETAGPIAIDNSDCSDRDVDVETVEENGSLRGSDNDKGPRRGADPASAANQREADAEDSGFQPTVESDAALQREVSTSDSRLLATIINELKGIAAPECGLSLNLEDRNSSDARKRPLRGQREVSHSRPHQGNWLAETRHPSSDLPEEPQTDDSRVHQGLDLPPLHTPIPLPQVKRCRVREEGKDLPPLLKQASPVRSHNRNTPPPLKHKYDSSPHLFSPHASVHADPVAVNSHVELNSADSPVDSPIDSPIDSRLGAELPKEGQAIPPISTLKRHFTNTLALRGEPASARNVSVSGVCSSDHFAPSYSHSAAASQAGPFAIRTTNHKPPTDSFCGSDKSPTCANRFPRLDFNSFHSSKLLPGLDGTKEVVSDCRSSPVDSHPVNSLSAIDFRSANTDWSKDKSAVTDSTSKGCRTVNPDSCRGVTGDPHPSSGVCTDVLSGASCNNTSPTGSVLTQSPSSARKTENPSGKPSPSRVSSELTRAASVGPLATDVRSSPAASEALTGNRSSSLVIHEEAWPFAHLPPNDLHRTRPAPPVNKASLDGAVRDGHSNHTALSSSTFQTSQLHPADSPPQWPAPSEDSCRDFQLPTGNHVLSSPRPAENQWRSQSPIDKRSSSSV